MISISKRQEQSFVFWAALGPLFIVFTLSAIAYRVPGVGLFIPLAIIVGLPLCWIWRRRGMVIAVSLLFLFLAAQYSSLAVSERFWFLGITLAFTLGFVITTLSFEELRDKLFALSPVQEPSLQKKEKEPLSPPLTAPYQGNRVAFEEKEKMWLQEKEGLLQELRTLRKKLREQEELVVEKEHLTQALMEERKGLYTEKEKFLEELLAAQQRHVDLEEELEKRKEPSPVEATVDQNEILWRDQEIERLQALTRRYNTIVLEAEKREEQVKADAEKVIEKAEQNVEHLRNSLAEAHRVLDKQKEQFQRLEAANRSGRDVLHQYEEERIETEKKLQNLQTKNEEQQSRVENLTQQLLAAEQRVADERKVAQQKVDVLEEQREELHRKGNALEQSTRGIQEQLQRKKEQLFHLRDLLNDTRVEKFQLKLDYEALQKQKAFPQKVSESAELDRNLRRTEGLYQQLRQQFDAKDKVLHEARSNLFKKEGELLLCQQKAEEREVEMTRILCCVFEQFAEVEQESLQREKEINLLEGVVSDLISSKV